MKLKIYVNLEDPFLLWIIHASAKFLILVYPENDAISLCHNFFMKCCRRSLQLNLMSCSLVLGFPDFPWPVRVNVMTEIKITQYKVSLLDGNEGSVYLQNMRARIVPLLKKFAQQHSGYFRTSEFSSVAYQLVSFWPVYTTCSIHLHFIFYLLQLSFCDS